MDMMKMILRYFDSIRLFAILGVRCLRLPFERMKCWRVLMEKWSDVAISVVNLYDSYGMASGEGKEMNKTSLTFCNRCTN